MSDCHSFISFGYLYIIFFICPHYTPRISSCYSSYLRSIHFKSHLKAAIYICISPLSRSPPPDPSYLLNFPLRCPHPIPFPNSQKSIRHPAKKYAIFTPYTPSGDQKYTIFTPFCRKSMGNYGKLREFPPSFPNPEPLVFTGFSRI